MGVDVVQKGVWRERDLDIEEGEEEDGVWEKSLLS